MAAHHRVLTARTRRWRSMAVITALALLIGAWLGTTGGPPATRGPVAIRLIDGTDPTSTDPSSTDPSTTTPTATVTPPPPAPDGYATQLDSLYSQLYQVAAALPGAVQSASEATPSEFDAQVTSATGDNLGYIAEQLPSATLTSLSSAVGQALPVEDAVAQSLNVHADATSTHETRHSTTHSLARPRAVAHYTTTLVEPQALTSIPLSLPSTDPYVDDSSNPYTASCPAGAPPINASDIYGVGDLFAIQIAIDVVDGVYNGLSPGAGTDTPVGIGIYIASAVLAAVGLGLQVAEDTLNYFQTIASDCQESQMQQVGIDTDNTAYQTYTLLSAVAATANETDQEVANLTNQDTSEFDQQLTLDIEQALSQPVGTTPMSSFELPVGYEGLTLNGYLNSTPVGVDEVVSSTIANMQATDQTMAPNATRDVTLAEQASAAGQFKLSFDYYRLAYQAAAG